MSEGAAVDPSRACMAAVAAMLEPAGYTVEQGEVATPDDQLTYPYLVVWQPPVGRASTSLQTDSTQQSATVQVTAVGRDVDEALAAQDRTAALLVDQVPVVDGRTFWPISQVLGAQVPRQDSTQHDPATGRPVYIAIGQYQLMSVPA